MPRKFIWLFLAVLCAGFPIATQNFEKYNVVWDTPGADARDSMPLGNGDIGLNVWLESNGDLVFYIAKSDAWGDNTASVHGLIKVGRVRVKLSPPPFGEGQKFTQTLRLHEGEFLVSGGTSTMRVWVDANRPVIHVDAQSAKPGSLHVALESWRREATKNLNADTIFPNRNNRIAWCYRNRNRQTPPLVDLTFGGVIKGAGLVTENAVSLHSVKPARTHSVAVYVQTAQAETAERWLAELNKRVRTLDATSPADCYRRHLAWWREFWDRSWIDIEGDADAQAVAQGYALQRFKNACTGRGAYAIKFNGSLFTSDLVLKRKVNGVEQQERVNADHRSWGGQYWFQNTRPIYWPMLKAGDFDLMLPLFRMYQGMLAENAKSVREYYGHGGSVFAETSQFWGGIGKQTADSPAGYTNHYFVPVLELAAIALDYYAYTGDKTFAREMLIPFAAAGLTFYDEHFQRDPNGKLALDPVNAIEMFWKARNPAPDVAGLRWVLQNMLALPPTLTDAATRTRWQKLLDAVPDLPKGLRDGKQVLLPFESAVDPKPHNTENPELYSIHPFRLFGVGKPDLDLARATFEARRIKRTGCWHQDPVQAALLGDAETAQKDVIVNFKAKAADLRFPAFWTAFHDYAPDEDNGGNGMIALQHMLLQADGRRIVLLPAWPKDWNARFKLRAPMNTTVSGTVRNGKISGLSVSPAWRRKDVQIP